MSFAAKTDYFGFASESVILQSSEEGKTATVVQAQDEKGDVVAQEIVGETSAPNCTYILKADATTNAWQIGKATAADGSFYTITSIQINTSAGAPPTIQIAGEEVPDQSHADCYYSVPTTTVKMCHHAQTLFGMYTFTSGKCYLTQANYTVGGSLTKATKDGETISYDIADGKIEAQLTFVSVDGSAPSVTPADGCVLTAPLTKSEPDAEYPTYTCTITKNMVHSTGSTGTV